MLTIAVVETGLVVNMVIATSVQQVPLISGQSAMDCTGTNAIIGMAVEDIKPLEELQDENSTS